MNSGVAGLSAVSGHAAVLRRAGYWRLSTGSTRALRSHALYRVLVLATTCFYLLQECIYAYQEKSDMVKMSRVMFLLLCHVTSLAKQFVFLTDADRIESMVAGLDEATQRALQVHTGAARGLLARAAAHAARLRRGYAGCAAFTCLLWAVFAAQAHARRQPFDFPLWIGVDTTDTTGFVIVLLYTYYVTTLVGVANTTMDAFIATVLYQCKTHLSILRMNFEMLPESASALSKASGRRRDDAFAALFVDCWQQYKRICETAGLVQDIFGGAILVQFGIGGWILCMAAYKIISLDFVSIEFASMILFILCILTELFLYCYYGTELTEESALVVDAAYGMRWAGEGRAARRLLLLLLVRARRPLRLAAGRVVPLSLDTFAKILKSSYTFYAVLRQTK
ncbi:PREDICTED: odorant receptor Or2-like [Papilio polytes]|uniref:odorant receptor Or2-like n=1 Tax=Papilio polytes TaxID=76194 RepID=UPI0006762A7F|nr:PREDICTED: odorant receptor Or2-like [Papilio polytes]XP_013149667.1 PREDICTED: odorant receptor Or2-like [Papilio polytes]XP_013149668.1 PREDICTED: odorant receptor Or2-like [Papilio polytes]XP_013149669.1 PREDICTED: odorant receptor Or2-like [Papilio polytes]WCC57619.1 odorant receptor 32 [Papilio polytes]